MAGSAPHIPGCRGLSLIGERVARSLYSAYSDSAGRQVTVTVFPPLSEGRTRAGFDEAAATAQRLGAHPSVLTIHEWGHAPDGRPWIVTDPQPAESVDTLLTLDGPLEVERALQVGVLLAGALETAHRAGIVHGDLQPARLVFGAQGEPLLVETGLASFAVFPGLGALNNPVRYHAPPEVLERTEVSPATDVYSLATTVYALLSGRAPHQKPAEVTDSNASLLLRILQMPVPRIDRPGLPAGLDDALGGPLSASPGKRPQQAIEVAWLLQDVQRRNGMAVTEPVVLELDGISGSSAAPPGLSTAADADWPSLAAPSPAAPVDADRSWPAERPVTPAWDPEPELPPATIFPFADGLPGAIDPAAGAGAAGAVPFGGNPFAAPADAGGAAAPSPWAPDGDHDAAAAEGAPLWPSTWPADAPPDDASAPLWPSSWPADQPSGDLPTWATPPGTAPRAGNAVGNGHDHRPHDEPDEPRGAHFGPARGGDGGSIDDVAGLTAGAGHAGADAAPFPDLGAIDRPPELDELPAWYTDPLPNRPDRAEPWSSPPVDTTDPGSAAARRADAASNTPAPWADQPVTPSPSPWADQPANPSPSPWADQPADPAPSPWADQPASPSPSPWADQPADAAPSPWADTPGNGGQREPVANGTADPWAQPADGSSSAAAAYRLPGAGDELRSLFGEVVSSDGTNGAEPRALGAGAPSHSPVAPGGVPDDDPLGPPQLRPPIDLSQLDRPLGPAPYLPARPAPASEPAEARAHADAAPTRLPRRGEAQTWVSPAGRAAGDGPAQAGLDAGPPARTPRPAPRQVAPKPVPPSGARAAAASAGPPALPVIILVAVVAVLALGVAWLVATGDDGGEPATDRGSSPAAGGADEPTNVQVNEVTEGVQVTWTGSDEASYVVTVLSTIAPPEALPATIGTSALVPNVESAATSAHCYTVTLADEDGVVVGEPTAPACTSGASPDQMQGT